MVRQSDAAHSVYVFIYLSRFLDVLCMVFSSHTIYYYAVTKFMDPTELLYCSW